MPPMPPLLSVAARCRSRPTRRLHAKRGGGDRFDPYADYDFRGHRSSEPPARPRRAGKQARKDETRVYFGADPLAGAKEAIKPWAKGQAPVVSAPSGDPDLKLAALAPAIAMPPAKAARASPTRAWSPAPTQRPQSPAERLTLTGKARAKAEKCLANAVYFEARGEPVRGQIAVAQVVMNRVFSPFYPDNVCGVVYQNANRHLACQFTFACDGVPDVVTEPDAWLRAKRIAHDMLDGKLWMPEVAKATHYHAYWVHPDWVSEMNKIYQLGVHTFYRPRAWGDGAAEPSWGDPKTTAKETKIIKKL